MSDDQQGDQAMTFQRNLDTTNTCPFCPAQHIEPCPQVYEITHYSDGWIKTTKPKQREETRP